MRSRHIVSLSKLVLVLSAGCSGAPRADGAVDATLSPVVLPVPPAASALTPIESPAVTLKRELCRLAIDREGHVDPTNERDTQPKCALAKVREVAVGTYVALLYRGPGDWKPDGSNASELGMMSEGDTDTFAPDFQSCGMFEYWLATVTDGKLAKSQIVTEICNDGHGAAGVGEDSVTISAGSIAVATNGGSAWRWGHSNVFSLPDLTPLSEASDGSWTVSSNTTQTEWSWADRRGATTWEAPRCDGSADPPTVGFSHAAVPSFEGAAALAGDGWKTVRSIDGCAATVDGEHAGFAIAGVASAASAKLALVVADDQLIIEIDDDKRVTEGKVHDELEVWHRRDPSSDWSQQCLPAPLAASGTEIRLGDLSTRLIGDKQGKPLAVERAPAKDGAPLRLRVTLPAKTGAVTVVYRDSDDGRRHERVIASSTFDARDDATLGALHRIVPDRASCERTGDSLVLRMKPHDPSTAIAGL